MGLGELLDAATIRDPASIAIICGNAAITRAELQRASSALADWLLTSGLKPGSRVAIHWCNSIEVVTLYFACFKAGLIAVPINLIWGQAVEACVVLRGSHSVSEEELRDSVRVLLADYKVPERVSFLPALPKGPTGKLDRRALAEMRQNLETCCELHTPGMQRRTRQ